MHSSDRGRVRIALVLGNLPIVAGNEQNIRELPAAWVPFGVDLHEGEDLTPPAHSTT